jgi:hypothetical protein
MYEPDRQQRFVYNLPKQTCGILKCIGRIVNLVYPQKQRCQERLSILMTGIE